MKWQLRSDSSSDQVESLARQLSTSQPFPRQIAEILIQRGIDTFEKARLFLKPQLSDLHDPFLMKDMDQAVARLTAAKEEGEKIWVYGDYDVDGTTAVSLLSLFFSAWEIEYEYYIPDRYQEGYGISYKGIDKAVEKGASLLISLDCGIKAVEKARYAKLKGLDLIICDHHRPGAELPEAVAVLDPKRDDCLYPFKELTGCGVGLKLCQAAQNHWLENGAELPEPGYDPLAAYTDLVTLSIACDIVPLEGENRALAFWGLKKLRENPLPGIEVIKELSEREREWNISDLVFFIGPHINSAGRLHHAQHAVEVMLGNKEGLISLANGLSASNSDRKEIDKQITEEALKIIAQDMDYSERHTTVLYQKDWHKGVIGIVASRLIEQHHRPTVLFTQSEGKLVGSARSVPGFNLYEALESCSSHLLQFGGHKYAAGLSLKEDDFASFAHAFEIAVAERIKPEHLHPILKIDARLDFSQLDDRFVRLLNRLSPFGPGNMTPVFLSTNVEVTDAVILKEDHVRLTLKQSGFSFPAIGFNLAKKWQEINKVRLDVAFQPGFNVWKEKSTINLNLKDIRIPHGS